MSFMCGLLLIPLLSAQAVGTTEDFKAAVCRSVIQDKLEDCDFAKRTSREFDGIQVGTEPGGNVSVSGKDHSGNSWNATYEATPGAGCQLWKVDLDRYSPDLAFLSFGANSSGGWDTTLSLLLFDRQGRPFPWQATSRFTVTDLGIRELALLGEARLPAVIVARQNSADPGQGNPEYQAYKFVADRASEIIGKRGNTVWPIISPLEAQHTVIAKGFLSTDEPNNGMPGASPISYLSLLGTTDSERRLHLSNEDIGVPKVLVVDANGTRQIISSPDKADLSKLKAGATVRAMLGQDCGGGQCSPMVLWVSE